MAISRHELKQDQFVSTLDSWYEFYLNYQRQIVIGAIIAVAIIVIAILGANWYRGRQATAASLLSQGVGILHAPLTTAGEPAPAGVTSYPSAAARANAALPLFRKVTNQYRGTASAPEAAYYIGLAERDKGDTAEAERDLRAAAAGPDARVSALAQNALANLYASLGQTSQAEASFRKLLGRSSEVAPKSFVLLELAELEARTNPAAAATLYRQIEHDYPQTLTAQQAGQELASLPAQ